MSFLALAVFPDLCVVHAVTNGPHPISHNTHHCQDCLLQQGSSNYTAAHTLHSTDTSTDFYREVLCVL